MKTALSLKKSVPLKMGNISGAISIPAKLAKAAKRFKLTERETQVAAELSAALPVLAIAERLGISAHTVDFHRRAIYRKTNSRCLCEFFLAAYLR